MRQTLSFSLDSVSKRSIPLVLPGLLFFLVAVSSAFAQIRVTGAGPYLQNFDPLAESGTDLPWANNSTLPGWFLYRQPAPGTDLWLYSAGSGTRAVGSIYSFGNGSDRALGGLGSNGAYFGSPSDGAVAAWIAFAATNDTGRVLTGFTVSFDGEQWRNGSNTTVEEMVFEYGIGQTFAGVSTWTAPGDRFN